MSCDNGDGSCDTPRRHSAFVALAIMAVIFVVLSIFSFLPSRAQVTPDTVSFGPYQANDGKRVFQAYNCMGCHTMVGNGAYLGPDLTEEYRLIGPAWLAAFLPSAGGWPTEAAVRTQLLDPNQIADAGTDSIEVYLKKYPGAAERIDRRGGHTSLMPNLPLTKDEVGQLIAYLKYTSAMDTEGWPPKVKVEGLDKRLRLAHGNEETAVPAAIAAEPSITETTAEINPVERGASLVKEYGCVACHAADKTKLVGPAWGGLYGSQVKLADGSTVTADDAYLAESIRQPGTQLVAGYPVGVMPAYDTLLKAEDVDAIVAYLHTLEKK